MLTAAQSKIGAGWSVSWRGTRWRADVLLNTPSRPRTETARRALMRRRYDWHETEEDGGNRHPIVSPVYMH